MDRAERINYQFERLTRHAILMRGKKPYRNAR
jgi:hypothetical protein